MSEKLRCFVIMPYSENSDLIFYKVISPTLQSMPGCNIIALRADQMDLRSLTLKAHIESSVKSADFIIADLTGFNPNVMYELGYASALEIPIVFISKGLTKNLPVGISESNVISYDEDNLLALREALSSAIQQVSRSIEDKQYLASYDSISEITCYQHGAFVDLKPAIRSAVEKIDILEINMNFIVANYLDDFKETLSVKKGLRIRILTLDPESDLAARRARQLGRDPYRYRNEMRDSIKKLYTLCKNYQSNLNLRLYDDLPIQNMFRFDDKIITAVVSYGRRTETNVHFVLDASHAGVADSFIYTFQEMWAKAVDASHIFR